jgi:hypothetical protein
MTATTVLFHGPGWQVRALADYLTLVPRHAPDADLP